MNDKIKKFEKKFDAAVPQIVNALAEVKKALVEGDKKLTFCLDCEHFRETGEVITGYTIGRGEFTVPGCKRYFCNHITAPIRKGTFEEFREFGCTFGARKKEGGKREN